MVGGREGMEREESRMERQDNESSDDDVLTS